jgi:hypothetical protein
VIYVVNKESFEFSLDYTYAIYNENKRVTKEIVFVLIKWFDSSD